MVGSLDGLQYFNTVIVWSLFCLKRCNTFGKGVYKQWEVKTLFSEIQC